MDLVLPQLDSFRPVEGQSAPVFKEEVLFLTIKPAEFKPFSPFEEASETPLGQDVLKQPRRFQAPAATGPTKPVPPVEGGAETLTEPDVSKHPRHFQALAAAGPAKVTNRFGRRERTEESVAESFSPNPSIPAEVPAEAVPLGPLLQLPAAVLAALAEAEIAFKNLPLTPLPVVDGTVRRSKERRGAPPP